MFKYLISFGVIFIFFITFLIRPAFAQNDCTIIYGGGETKCKATTSAEQKMTTTPTPAPAEQSPSNSGTTKGGLPVYEPSQATQSPETGPEAFALITLVPAAALGFYLRNKVK